MKKVLSLLCVTALLLALCSCGNTVSKKMYSYGETYFDTTATVYAYTNDSSVFDQVKSYLKTRLEYFSMLFSIYDETDEFVNLKAVNENAGKGPVAVNEDLVNFLEFCQEASVLTGGETDVAMGSVIKLWKECYNDSLSNNAHLPDKNALDEASKHIDISKLVINKEEGTVYFEDPLLQLDVGSVAKGYVCDLLAKELETFGIPVCLNIGGNVKVCGPSPSYGWVVGISNPVEPTEASCIVRLPENYSCVTSGLYRRGFTYDGVYYHHIIDVDTLYPLSDFESVSVVAESSAKCDALSTALFNMSLEEGKALIESLDGFEAYWIFSDGSTEMTSGFAELLK